jgi:hypothetical protein
LGFPFCLFQFFVCNFEVLLKSSFLPLWCSYFLDVFRDCWSLQTWSLLVIADDFTLTFNCSKDLVMTLFAK